MGSEERTSTECDAAFYRAKETVLDAHLSREAAELIRKRLASEGLDHPHWDRFLPTIPSAAQQKRAEESDSTDDDEDEKAESRPNDPLTGGQVLSLRSEPVECAPTEFDPLDKRLRGGGIPRGLLTCFSGAPESGKTRLLCQVGLGLSKTMPVVMLLTDWGRAAAVDIMTVMLGFDPAKIDEDPRGAREWYELQMVGRPLFLLDDGDPLISAFDFADTMGHCAVLLDSFQTVSPVGIPGIEKAPPYEKNRLIARYVRERIRGKGNRQDHTVIFTSESNRASYAAKNKDDRAEDISSPLGGGIDYAADLLLSIHRPDGDADQRTLVFAKNRYRPFLTRLPRKITVDYRPDGQLFEVSQEAAERAERSAYESTIVPIKRVIRQALEPGPIPSFRKLRDAVQALDPKLSDANFARVLKIMTRVEKSVIEGDGPGRSIIFQLAYDPED